jgi:hypothetical protein
VSFARRRRTPRDELAERTAHGDVYLRRLRRAQFALTTASLVAFGALVGALPALLVLAPSLGRHHIAGVPVADWLVIGPLFPLFVAIGWLYQRRADALDDAFRDLVRDE